jgi:hypothetical protein
VTIWPAVVRLAGDRGTPGTAQAARQFTDGFGEYIEHYNSGRADLALNLLIPARGIRSGVAS